MIISLLLWLGDEHLLEVQEEEEERVMEFKRMGTRMVSQILKLLNSSMSSLLDLSISQSRYVPTLFL